MMMRRRIEKLHAVSGGGGPSTSAPSSQPSNMSAPQSQPNSSQAQHMMPGGSQPHQMHGQQSMKPMMNPHQNGPGMPYQRIEPKSMRKKLNISVFRNHDSQ